MPKSMSTENRFSICIGINRYAPNAGLGELRFAEDDARAVDELLGQTGFASENRILLIGKAATLEAINVALSDNILDRPHENDLIVFYFAGHSAPLTFQDHNSNSEPRSEVFLASYDFDRQKMKQSRAFRKQHALGMERLRKDFFEGEGARKRLFLFDSCYSGDFYGPRYRNDTDPIQGYMQYILESSSTGRVALSSCLPLQKAVEETSLEHGRFTYYLLQGLSGKAPEAQRADGCITVNSLFEYVASRLPPDQRPVLSGVQQDTFTLICYPKPSLSKHSNTVPAENDQHTHTE
jgi:hypothetical protein